MCKYQCSILLWNVWICRSPGVFFVYFQFRSLRHSFPLFSSLCFFLRLELSFNFILVSKIIRQFLINLLFGIIKMDTSILVHITRGMFAFRSISVPGIFRVIATQCRIDIWFENDTLRTSNIFVWCDTIESSSSYCLHIWVVIHAEVWDLYVNDPTFIFSENRAHTKPQPQLELTL